MIPVMSPILGWIPPDGSFITVDYGSHNAWAREYITNRLNKTEDEIIRSLRRDRYSSNIWGDYLVYIMGWVLVDAPAYDVVVVRDESKRLTKRQKETLYDYFADMGAYDIAHEYI